MPIVPLIPAPLVGGPFTTATARRVGIGRGVLAGKRFRQLFRGVWVAADVELTFRVVLAAARLALPADVIVTHTSAMRLYGLEPRTGRHPDVEFSTNATTVTMQRGIRLHRRGGRLRPAWIDGFPVTGPERTFVDCATRLTFVELVQLGDWLIQAGHTTFDSLVQYCLDSHLHGVRRARRVVAYVRDSVESPMETVIRLMIVFARLPEPACNVDILLEDGEFLARGDLLLARWMVLVEYDGWYHERDGRQRQHDIHRRERLEAAGWTVIAITSTDLGRPREIPWRVYRAIKARGYMGPAPRLNVMWLRWFA